MPVPALATLKPISTPPLLRLILVGHFKVQQGLLAPILFTQVASSVVVRSATTGSSPPFGSLGLRPTYKVLWKERAVVSPLLSLIFRLVLATLRWSRHRLRITRQK